MIPLKQAALELMLNDDNRINAISGAAQMRSTSILAIFTNLYDYVVCQNSYDENDTTLGVNVADAIYNYLHSLELAPKCP